MDKAIIGKVETIDCESGQTRTVESLAMFDPDEYDEHTLRWLWARAWLNAQESS